jgi:hypothetical protein
VERVTVHQADSIAWLATQAERRGAPCFDHTITDPPYPDHVQGEGKMFSTTPGKRAREVSAGFASRAPLETFVPNVLSLTRRWSLFFCDLESLGAFRDVAHESHVRSGLYVKTRAQPQLTADRPGSGAEGIAIFHGAQEKKRWNNGGKANVWYACPENRSVAMHPTSKPVMLCAVLLEAFTDPEELVFDPFAGAGNMGLACLLLGRRYYGLELNAEHVASARAKFAAFEAEPGPLRERWEKYKLQRDNKALYAVGE